MSRGHGRAQRALVDRLVADDAALKEGLPLSALRSVLPSDRSNRRRTILTLIQRGDVEVLTDPETGERRLRMPFMAGASAWWKRNPPVYGRRGDCRW